MKNITKLQRALDNSEYVLHGSPWSIKGALEPGKAYDEAKEGGNQVAVYATANISIAVWKAVARQKRKNLKYMVGWSWNDNGEKVVYGKNIALKKGYVYILSSEFFRPVLDDASDYVSAVPVTPPEKVKVSPKDLLDLQKEMRFVIEIDSVRARLAHI